VDGTFVGSQVEPAGYEVAERGVSEDGTIREEVHSADRRNMIVGGPEPVPVRLAGRRVHQHAADRLSFLWPRMLDGVRLLGAGPQDIVSITTFDRSMTQMPASPPVSARRRPRS
jgi:hypothetical protein